jgi:preprotein translocase subunit SecA
MLMNFLTKIFGSKNEREIRRLMPLVERINALEPQMQAMTDDELKNQTSIFKERFEQGESLDDMLPEAFATVREASVRTLKMRHFDVQLIGGIVLHQGKISEMKTGEGKTLVSTLPAYLNAIPGKGVHIITVNDYLAKRDTEWMGQIYRFLGLSVGTIVHGLDDSERQREYNADITYGTNNEFGFDYLRDNMKYEKESLVQRDLHYAIVDEVDSILVDEARTPLIISGPAEKSTDLYYKVNTIIPRFSRDSDYTIDEKARSVVLTEEGVAKSEKSLGVENLYDPKHIELLHHVNQALKAHTLFKRDVDYIVKEGEVIIVDEFTGRLMPGRRYSEGLHQALEAKEGVKIENENQTLATITFQNYFRMYDKLAGMTGTADTEAAEFKKIYNLDVSVIPTNQPMIRKDFPDVIYKTKREKYEAVLDEIAELHKKQQPVLVGTISIDVSEDLSKKLARRGIPHSVLNAKNHEKEAEIVAQAGRKGMVTIATNMAGRGTDIVLGGNPENLARMEAKKREIEIYDKHNRITPEFLALVAEMETQTKAEHDEVIRLGGLHILGTERHESRRIDNQLRGRSGRQGDPGSSRFYMALEDDLLRIFGGERISAIMDRLGIEEGEPIEHTLISKAIENAQSKVEAHNFDIRKHLLEYDNVMNQQREVIYAQRREALSDESLKPSIEDMIWEKSEEIAQTFADDKVPPSEWDLKAFEEAVFKQFNFRLRLELDTIDHLNSDALTQMIYDAAVAVYNKKESDIGDADFRRLERIVMLQTIDNLWKDHLLNMDHLKEGIGLRGYAQQDPLIVYKREGFEMFSNMISRVKEEILNVLFRVQIAEPENIEEMRKRKEQKLTYSGSGDEDVKRQPVRKDKKVGRNDPCPCGSGKKHKKCCGA